MSFYEIEAAFPDSLDRRIRFHFPTISKRLGLTHCTN